MNCFITILIQFNLFLINWVLLQILRLLSLLTILILLVSLSFVITSWSLISCSSLRLFSIYNSCFMTLVFRIESIPLVFRFQQIMTITVKIINSFITRIKRRQKCRICWDSIWIILININSWFCQFRSPVLRLNLSLCLLLSYCRGSHCLLLLLCLCFHLNFLFFI